MGGLQAFDMTVREDVVDDLILMVGHLPDFIYGHEVKNTLPFHQAPPDLFGDKGLLGNSICHRDDVLEGPILSENEDHPVATIAWRKSYKIIFTVSRFKVSNVVILNNK